MAFAAATKSVMDTEMQLRSALVTKPVSARRGAVADALADRRRAAAQAYDLALRLGLRACATPALPIPGIVR
jgi:hypothetical protein